MTEPATADDTSSTTLSLLDLRRELIRRSTASAQRARRSRARGDLRDAVRHEREAERLRAAARAVRAVRRQPPPLH